MFAEISIPFMLKKVLHIDDDEDDHEIFAAALSEATANAEVVFIDNAREALHKLTIKDVQPDIIFLDLNMPEMSGQEFLYEIKKHKNISHIPVFVLSTSSHKPTIELAKEAGASGFFTKPERLEDMVGILREVLI